MSVSPIEDVVSDLSQGKMVILLDDESRENEGDLVLPADFVTPEAVNFMATHGKGLLCLALSSGLCEKLNFYPMVPDSPLETTSFTVTIDSSSGISTGISVYDRSVTISKVVLPHAKPDDFVRPGHVFPLRSSEGGVLVRSGHTEASVDLCGIAGLSPAALICEILDEDGDMHRLPGLVQFSAEFGCKLGLIQDLVCYRLQNESLFSFEEEIFLEPNLCLRTYRDSIDASLWFVLFSKDFSFPDVMPLDFSLFGDFLIKGNSLVQSLSSSPLSPAPGSVALFRGYHASSLDFSFRSLLKASSVKTLFERTRAVLSFIARDLSCLPPNISMALWRSCFGIS